MVRALATIGAVTLLGVALGAAPHARAGNASARLVVSAHVVRTVAVSVIAGAVATASGLEVRTSAGDVWSGTVAEAARVPGMSVATYAPDSRYLVVTVHADAPLAPAAARLAR